MTNFQLQYFYQIKSNLSSIKLRPEHVLLRGSQLRNTKWIYGVALYTGMETKLMKVTLFKLSHSFTGSSNIKLFKILKNSNRPPFKRSQIETAMNKQVLL